jgi:hypothetical protein
MIKAHSYDLDGIRQANYKFATIDDAIKFGEEKLHIKKWEEDATELMGYYNNSENHQEYLVIFKWNYL